MGRLCRILASCWLISLICFIVTPARVAAAAPSGDHQLVLPGGTMLIERHPTSPGTAAIVAIMLAGTAGEQDGETHAAHIAEHLVFQNRVAGQRSFTDSVASFGGVLNGHADLEYTAFEIAVPEEHLAATLQQLSSSLFASEYEPEVYRRELEGYLRFELRTMTQRYPTALHNAFRQQVFLGTPYAEGLFDADITEVPRAAVEAWQRRSYGANRLILVVNSDLPWEQLLTVVRPALAGVPQATPAAIPAITLHPSAAATVNVAGSPEGLFMLGLSIDQVDPADQANLSLLLEVLRQRLQRGANWQLRAESELCLVSWQRDSAYLQLAFHHKAGVLSQGEDLVEVGRAQLATTVRDFAQGMFNAGDLELLYRTNSAGVAPGSASDLALGEALEAAEPYIPIGRVAIPADYQTLDQTALLRNLQKVAGVYLPRANPTCLTVTGETPGVWAGFLVVLAMLSLAAVLVALVIRSLLRRNQCFRAFVVLISVTIKSAFRSGRASGSAEGRDLMSFLQLLASGILTIVVFQLSEVLTRICLTLGQPELLFVLSATTLAMLMIFSGGYLLLSVFLRSNDSELLLAMPLTSGQIVLARLTIVTLGQYPLACLFLFPPVLKYTSYLGGSPAIWLTAVAITLLLPVLALTLVALPLVAGMHYLTPKLRERLGMIWSLLAAVASLLLRFGPRMQTGQTSLEAMLMQQLQLRQADLTTIVGRVFPPAIWVGHALAAAGSWRGVSSLLLFSATSLGCLYLLYRLSLRCFLGGATEVSRTHRGRRKRGIDLWQATTPGLALLLREWRLFWRTPALLVVTLPNMFVPVLLAYPALRPGIKEQGVWVMAQVLRGEFGNSLFLAVATAVAAMLLVVSSRLASISISSEGSQFYFSRMIPVDCRLLIQAKLANAVAVNAVCLLPAVLLATVWLRPSWFIVVAMLLAGGLGLLFASAMCIHYDLSAPFLDWDNPQTLIRRGTSLVPMLTTLGIFSVTVLLVFSMSRGDWSMTPASLIVLLLYAILAWRTYRSLMLEANKLYDQIEV